MRRAVKTLECPDTSDRGKDFLFFLEGRFDAVARAPI